MGETEIPAEPPKLQPEEPAGKVWFDDGGLTDDDKTALDAALADYQKNPDAGTPWREALARIQDTLRP
jgi:hypothetical protein